MRMEQSLAMLPAEIPAIGRSACDRVAAQAAVGRLALARCFVVGLLGWLLVPAVTWADRAQVPLEPGVVAAGAGAAGSEPVAEPVAQSRLVDRLLAADPYPVLAVISGTAAVLILLIGLRLHAFLALLLAAVLVSAFVPADQGADYIQRVALAFGKTAGGVGIVIAMAAIIGKCMLDSGAADRVVQFFSHLFGQSRTHLALLVSGFVLAVPVFFDTVFFLLVPLARSLHRRTGRHYIKYVTLVGAGGAITHTLVPPTPGPLFVAATLGVNLGVMILVGLAVAIPSAVAGLTFAWWIDRRMPDFVPAVAQEPGLDEAEETAGRAATLPPSLWASFAPVVVPVTLISVATVLMLWADVQPVTQLKPEDVRDMGAIGRQLADPPPELIPLAEFLQQSPPLQGALWEKWTSGQALEAAVSDQLLTGLNTLLASGDLSRAELFAMVRLNPVAERLLPQLGLRMKPSDRQRLGRSLLESAFPDHIAPHQWETPLRRWADVWSLIGHPNTALIVAALISLGVLAAARRSSAANLSQTVEQSLLSGGVIILITAAGGAFGEMLQAVGIDRWVQAVFSAGAGGSWGLLLLAYAITAVMKIAVGSSTVAMLISAGMMAAVLGQTGGPDDLPPVFLATAIGSGSLVISWMNDSGFWIFARLGGLTEPQTLKTWTVCLAVLSVTGLLATIVLWQLSLWLGWF
jgi:gluconate:H+ symporter, GntP family